MPKVKVTRETFTAVKHWIMLIVSMIYFIYMWFITKPENWVVETSYDVRDKRTGDKILDPTSSTGYKVYGANMWTEYNILRGSSLAFLLGTFTSVIVDLMDYHDIMFHIYKKDK